MYIYIHTLYCAVHRNGQRMSKRNESLQNIIYICVWVCVCVYYNSNDGHAILRFVHNNIMNGRSSQCSDDPRDQKWLLIAHIMRSFFIFSHRISA